MRGKLVRNEWNGSTELRISNVQLHTMENLEAGETIRRRRGVVLTAEGADLVREQNKIKRFGILVQFP